MNRSLQLSFAVLLAVFVFIILVHPAVDLPDGATPTRNLGIFVIVCLGLLISTAAASHLQLPAVMHSELIKYGYDILDSSFCPRQLSLPLLC